MGLLRQIQGGPITDPSGTLLPGAEIRITLVDAASHAPAQAIDAPTSQIIYGTETVLADASALVDFSLWPNDRGHSATVWRVELPDTGIRPFYASVPEHADPLSWLDFITGGSPLSPSDLTALQVHLVDDDRHMTVDQNAALDAANSPTGANPIATMTDVVAAGGGDMHTLTYDPRGIADDAFDISNLTGNLDGGVFT